MPDAPASATASQAKPAFLFRPPAENERQFRADAAGPAHVAILAFLFRPPAVNERQLDRQGHRAGPGRAPGRHGNRGR